MLNETLRTWESRPVLSRLLRIAILLLPIAVSMVAASLAAALMPEPTTVSASLVWWTVFVCSAAAPLYVCTRLAKRLLPLAALLELTLVFPDKAPSRLAVAKQAGRTRDLKARLAAAREEGRADETAELVLVLISTLGEHDRLTRGHSERVRAFVDMLADKVDLSRDERERLRWGALLHDIGKLRVAVEILNKPGRPSEEEWVALRRHPIDGAELLGPLAAWLGPWVGAVTDHHERWDGAGYPRGLEGEDISLGGRILAIADSYEVMTAARPYKKPLPAGAAREELARCAGSHFDPGLVRAFLDLSVGRLWLTIGAAAFLAQLPILAGLSVRGLLQRFGRSAATATGAIAAGAALVVSGAIDVPHLDGRGPVEVAATVPSGSDGARQEGSVDPGDEGRPPPRPGADASEGAEPGAEPEQVLAAAVQGPDAGSTVTIDPGPGPGGGPGGGGGHASPEVPPKVQGGRIDVPALVEQIGPGVTESDFLSSCDVPQTQGLDAFVFEIDEADALSLEGSDHLGSTELVARAYDERCDEVGGFDSQMRRWSPPPTLRYLVVVAPTGVDTTVELKTT